MSSWYATLKHGLSRAPAADRLAGGRRGAGWADLHNLRPFAARHWRQGLASAALVVATSLLGLAPPLIARYLFDDVILARQLGRLAAPALLLAGVKALEMAGRLLQEYTVGRLERDVLLDIQGELLERTLRFPKSFFDEQQVGYLMPRLLSDVEGLRWFFAGTLPFLASQVVQMVGGAVLLFYLEWRLALVVALALPALVVSVRYFSRRLYALSHHSREQEAHAWQRTQESLSAASLIKAFASERYEAGRVMAELRAALQISLEQVVVGSLARVTINAVGELARAVALLAGAALVILARWTAGSLLAFYSYLGRVYGPAQALATANLQLQSARAALERISALFDIVPEENLETGLAVERLRGEVEFKGVSFAYDGGEPVLEDVSFAVRPGERVAIVGPSGVGKTTLLSLILRFYRPTQGEIWFDGRPASDYELASLRRRIGYVAQSTLLLSGTIGDNLRYGNPEAGQEQVEQAARAAGIHDFVASLPEGYDSPLGERGANLSEGQRQRLAIARALIKDPDIVVLDEPTSALDSLLERSIFDALPALLRDKTLFVVAHRLSTVQDSDRILLLNEKRLVAMGTHQELLEGNDYYRSLVEKQCILLPAG